METCAIPENPEKEPVNGAATAKVRTKPREFDSYTKYALTEKQIRMLLESCYDQNDRVMILIGYRYGLRRDDLAKIETNNVDLKNSTLIYYEQKKRRMRQIPIEADVLREIRILINSSKKRKYLLSWHDGSTCWRHLQDLCEVAGVPIPPGRDGLPFHALRGTCIKFRQSQGWTINQCAALIGDTVATVTAHYATTTPSELAELMNSNTNK